ncbi:NADH dehydrogenase I flavoprotein 24kDa subunit [Cyanidioschyzon merolae strain 10D]|uniref:NADH dehydrogenase I flavoprotein 24kDa subunit n=1 Tax=Cyanidioschyzon merolae (strain NIES-3377 / 10D) TaxID=280699 RepID=M1V6R9_CYAM1|nr:NADH dehydrogenase I flavoprotein 24kDa subunit [Cyanidioschyzon merolae strain 10D]BAM82430.1 NADH dehydrogenase I flavoprotein 24kDa subunit [Cyanidioschyzon merolae strain 10D]|eukprot:XP_005538466.1 NADH dehydrogenase I flavoprotein 24kDa subunit [Cyanidioschyzon merolae strain 10D]
MAPFPRVGALGIVRQWFSHVRRGSGGYFEWNPRRALAGRSNVHRDSEGNSEFTTFDFSEDNYKKIAEILKRYPVNYKQSAVIPVLDLAQRECGGWLPLAAMNKVAQVLGMQPMRVYEIATFYTMFNTVPIGKYNVQVCTTTPCMLRGAYDILRACEEESGARAGGDSPDGLFHIMEVECLGACANAPMMQINDDYYEDLTPQSAKAVLKSFRDGNPLKPGPQVARKSSMGIQGKTTLLEEPPGPSCRDL